MMKNKLFALLAAVLLLAGCNNEDDVLEIFTGKTWKLTYISAENSHEQYNFWNNDKESEQSFSALKQEGTFTVTFEGTNLNNVVGGTFNAKGINATIDGEWNANGESHEMSTAKTHVSISEKDKLAQAFVTGLQNAIRYGGDDSNLYIYYEDKDGTVKRMNFKAQ